MKKAKSNKKTIKKTIKVILKAFDGEMEMKSKLFDFPYDTLFEIEIPIFSRYPRAYYSCDRKDIYNPIPPSCIFIPPSCIFKWDGEYYEYRKGKFARVYYLIEFKN